MIVDSSALVAIVRGEPEAMPFINAISSAECRMSVANWFETTIVVDRNPARSRREFDVIVEGGQIELVPVTVEQARIARVAHREFGRGSGHPAGLNMGDCFAYALAKDTGEPLLFKGDDFGHTDIRSALD